MQGDVTRAVFELADAVERSRIQGIHLLDPFTLLFDLYTGSKLHVLAVSLKKGKAGFHLLFEKVHPAYLYESPATKKLYSLIHGMRVEHLHCSGRCVCMALSPKCFLLFDFKELDISLFDAGGRVFRYFKGISKPGEPDRAHMKPGPCMEDLHAIETADSGKGGPGMTAPGELFPVNKSLSLEFFNRFSDALSLRVIRIVRGERKKALRLLEKLDMEAKELEDRELFRIRGELLKYNLTKIRRGDSSVTLKDFGGHDVEIPLDPSMDPAENMKRYFEKYKKLGRKLAVFEQKYRFETNRLNALDRALRILSDRGAVTLQTPPPAVLEILESAYIREDVRRRVAAAIKRPAGQAASAGGLSARPMKKRRGEGFLRFVSKSGKMILVGRNARENEELVIRKARGNDLWFHVEEGTGSAVVLRYDRKGEFQDRDILDAAVLALYFSRLRSQGEGSVVYTHCKYVRKPKGTKTGYVTYHRNKTKHVVLDEGVLNRLIDSKMPLISPSLKIER